MDYEAVAIGCSAGGIQAVQTILARLPATFCLPVVVVLHTAPNANNLLAGVLSKHCCLRVKEAEEKEVIGSGTVYLAAPNYHLLVERNTSFSLSVDEKVCFSRPSIDVLFESMADVYRERLIAVVLTGANGDGSEGLLSVRKRGGLALVQTPETAAASIMPQRAIDLAGADYVESIEDIAERLVALGGDC